MILGIVGSREFEVPHAFLTSRYYIEYWLKRLQPELVVSGGANGIDSIAIEVAQRLGFQWEEILPANEQWEPNGYKDRNVAIATKCDAIISIRCSAATTYGSGWTADYAKKLGKAVKRYVF